MFDSTLAHAVRLATFIDIVILRYTALRILPWVNRFYVSFCLLNTDIGKSTGSITKTQFYFLTVEKSNSAVVPNREELQEESYLKCFQHFVLSVVYLSRFYLVDTSSQWFFWSAYIKT